MGQPQGVYGGRLFRPSIKEFTSKFQKTLDGVKPPAAAVGKGPPLPLSFKKGAWGSRFCSWAFCL